MHISPGVELDSSLDITASLTLGFRHYVALTNLSIANHFLIELLAYFFRFANTAESSNLAVPHLLCMQ